MSFSVKSVRTVDQPISFFMQQAVENPRLISLAAGLVDYDSLPAHEVEEAVRQVLGDPRSAQVALQYGTTQGLSALRQVLLERTAALDRVTPAAMSLTPDDCLITTGSQQLLYLVSEALLDPGDLVITAAPSYFVYQGTLQSMGVRTLSVPQDADGMQTDALADLLAYVQRRGELPRLKLVYVVDYFDNPTGSTLSLPRRAHLLELVERYSRDHRLVLVEDAAYRELRYDGDDLPSIKSLDTRNAYVVLAMTFSKACAPGLKTGYAFVPRDLREPLLRLKGNHDFGSNNFTQHVVHRLVKSGAYDRHVAVLREVYRRKRDALCNALEQALEPGWRVRWARPAGGLYVWLRLPEWVETGPGSPLARAAWDEGVLYVPGQFCYLPEESKTVPRHEIRLSFGVGTPADLREGVMRLARACKKVLGAAAQDGCPTPLASLTRP
ncbi:MAG: PLP-dependent aminotransferase family protein [Gemmataceae bacterium]